MAPLLQSPGMLQHMFIAAGLPPSVKQGDGEPLGLTGSLLIIGFFALASWASPRLVGGLT